MIRAARGIGLASCVLILGPLGAAGSGIGQVPGELSQAAQQSLVFARQFAKGGGAYLRLLGLRSQEEADQLQLGVPRLIFYALPAKSPSVEANFDTADEVLYPLIVNHETRASITFRTIGGKWQRTRLGYANLSRAVAQALRKVEGPALWSGAGKVALVGLPDEGYGVARLTNGRLALTSTVWPVMSTIPNMPLQFAKEMQLDAFKTAIAENAKGDLRAPRAH